MSRPHAFFVALLLGLSAVLVSGATQAQDEKADAESPPALDPGVTKVDLAYSLLDYGRTHKTPEALVTAALILTKIPFVDHTETSAEKPKLSTEQITDIGAILDEAARMRPKDKVLMDLVSRAHEDLKEASRSLLDVRGMMPRIKIQIPRGKQVTVARKKYKKGETIHATVDIRQGAISIENTATRKSVAKGKGSVAARAPQTGTYEINVMNPPGSASTSVTLTLR